MIEIPLKTGPWIKADLDQVPKHGHTVLSTFSCGGGSSFGYKLAGFDVIGCVEIDPKMYEVYKANHKFKYGFNMSIQKFNLLPDDEIPKELWDLDVLDGSPPCSTFSMAGSREKKWGSEHHFREGQAKQHLDDLFFDFIATAKRLQPKVVVAENVKGLIQGNAKGYVKQIFQGFKDAGYHCQLFLLNAAAMGVPQRRERTFFIANRLGKKISLKFDEDQVSVEWPKNQVAKNLTELEKKYWSKTKQGEKLSKVHPTGAWFTYYRSKKIGPQATLISKTIRFHFNEPRHLSGLEYKRVQTFPDDYNSNNNDMLYICGMSVPPYMMQRIANQIYRQLLFEKKCQKNAVKCEKVGCVS